MGLGDLAGDVRPEADATMALRTLRGILRAAGERLKEISSPLVPDARAFIVDFYTHLSVEGEEALAVTTHGLIKAHGTVPTRSWHHIRFPFF